MKNVIAELDKIAALLENSNETWAVHLAYRIDNVTQSIENALKLSNDKKASTISKNVLEAYREDMEFLSSKENKLKELIKSHNTKDASKVYRTLKAHFGKLNRKESIRFIQNVIRTMEK